MTEYYKGKCGNRKATAQHEINKQPNDYVEAGIAMEESKCRQAFEKDNTDSGIKLEDVAYEYQFFQAGYQAAKGQN